MMITSYDQMPIGVFKRFSSLCEEKEREGREESDINLEILALLTGSTVDELLGLPYVEFRLLMDRASFLLEKPKEKPVRKVYELGGYRLRPSTRVEKFTAGQYIDFQSYAADLDGNMEKLVSVFLVPEGHRYGDGYDVNELQALIRERLPITDANALLAFFLKCAQRSARRSLYFLEMQTKVIRAKTERQKEAKAKAMETIAALRRFLENGAGPLR